MSAYLPGLDACPVIPQYRVHLPRLDPLVPPGFLFCARTARHAIEQFLERAARFVDPVTRQRREQLHRDVAIPGQLAPHGLQCVARGPAAELVGFRQQDVDREAAARGEFEHRLVVLGERMPHVHDDDRAAQRLALGEVPLEQAAPVRAHVARHLGEAVAGQVDEPAAGFELEEIEQAGRTGALAGPRQPLALGDRIDGARLARVGTAGHGNLGTDIGRQLHELVGAGDETDVRIGGHAACQRIRGLMRGEEP